MKMVRYSALLVSLVLAVACSGGGSTGPGGSSNSGGNNGGGTGGNTDPYGGGTGNTTCPAGSVCFLSASFEPGSLTIAKGTTVNFVNNSGISHTVNFDGTRPPGVTDIPLNSSGTFARTFNDAGRYAFHCTQHAGMTGEVVVQ